MYLDGTISGKGARILVDTTTKNNIIDTSLIRLIGLIKQRGHTDILICHGDATTRNGTCFNIHLRIDAETYQIVALLVTLTNKTDATLGTPWLVALESICWNFNTMDMSFR